MKAETQVVKNYRAQISQSVRGQLRAIISTPGFAEEAPLTAESE